jgi:hypothetical protein
MRIVERTTLAPAEPGTSRAVAAFATFVPLADGSLLASYSIGSGKDTDDITLELRRSADGGRTWGEPERPFDTTLNGRKGSLKVGPMTRLDGDRLIMAALWIDREAFPGQPLFNPETEGCLPMAIVLAESPDGGRRWSLWRTVPMPDDVGPPSLTNAILRLPSGRLALSIETNKTYLDASKWFQRVVYSWSEDGGATWSPATTVVEDATGRIANWDQRAAVAPDGRIVTFTWMYDFEAVTYLNVHRRLSRDEGRTWSEPEDLGFTDQPSHPAILPDGRTVVAWVDRFGTQSIRARAAEAVDAPFPPETEVVLYTHETSRSDDAGTTADALVEMGTWSYGLAFAEALPDGDVGVVHYAPGERGGTEIRWLRLRLD